MRALALTATLLIGWFLPWPLGAGGTPTPLPSELLQHVGAGSALGNGDFVSTTIAPGLDTFYSYYVEVPPGTASLVVQIFDADIGAGGGGGAFDVILGGGVFNTSVSYSLIDPAGTVVGTALLGPGVCGGCNNNWAQFAPIAAPLAGHWELRVDMSSAVTAGSDLNGLGVRAHDGTAGAGGTELNVYAESYLPIGTIGNPSSSTTNLYPYISSGCEFDSNDFDGDAPQAGSALSYTSRTGVFSQSVGISAASAWLNSTLTGWTSDNNSVDYGIWHAQHTITAVSAGLGANVVSLWNGAFDAANPPTGGVGPAPTGQPENGSLRIYFPRDGGGAPVKPYSEQLLTHVSGPNPPLPGQVSRVRVTVRVVNPSPNSILFAAPARVVTATVPGAGAVYAGDPLLSQGGLTAQPALGGTGSLVWDPGAVAAGGTALMAYLVDVTPPAPGSRVAVTGTPGSLGTTATFLDETSRLAQARATFSFGPLCELAVTAGLNTHATVVDVRGFATPGGALIEWHTTSEIATERFEVYRHDRTTDEIRQIHQRPVLSLLTAPQGGRYRLLDPNAESGDRALYSIVEVERGGNRHLHGPFEVRIEPPSESEMSATDSAGWLSAQAHRSEGPTRSSKASSKASSAPWPSDLKVRGAKISTLEQGLYLVPTADLAEVLRQPIDKVRRAIRRHHLALSLRGKPVAWTVHPRGLLFFATPSESQYSTENIYLLEFAEGIDFERRLAPSPSGTGPSSFPALRQIEEDRFAATAFSPDPEGDYWFWKTVISGHAESGRQEFLFEAPGVTRRGTALLEARFQSATDSGRTDEHQARLILGDTELGTTSWTGVKSHRARFEIPESVLLEHGNRLIIEGILGPDVPFAGYFVDGFDLTYPRRFELENGELEIRGADGSVTVHGSEGRSIHVLDVTDPSRPMPLGRVETVWTPTGSAARFEAEPDSLYWAMSSTALKAPRVMAPLADTALSSPANRADYVVIAPAALLSEAQRLASRRSVEPLDTRVIATEWIYDEYSAGFPEPQAIQEFLHQTLKTWTKAPRSVALAGSGSFDFRDLLGFGTNLIPPMMVSTPDGLFASDQPFSDLDGDGYPNMAIGRIPARNADELSAYIAKLEAYEASPAGSWRHRWLAVADRSSDGADFTADSDDLTAQLPATVQIETAYLDSGSSSAAQDALFAAWQEGVGLVHYFGHGGLDRLGSDGLMTATNAPVLSQSPRLPTVLAPTCAVNRFALPGFQALGEVLVMDPNGGAISVFSSTSLSQHPEAKLLSRSLRDALVTPKESIGRALHSAMVDFLDRDGNPNLLRVYTLLGDPETATVFGPSEPLASPASGES